jgi:hypothetical protein
VPGGKEFFTGWFSLKFLKNISLPEKPVNPPVHGGDPSWTIGFGVFSQYSYKKYVFLDQVVEWSSIREVKTGASLERAINENRDVYNMDIHHIVAVCAIFLKLSAIKIPSNYDLAGIGINSDQYK